MLFSCEMNLEPSRGDPPCIFCPQSINLCVSPSNSGKTHFIKTILSKPELYFLPHQIERVVYINANPSALCEPPLVDNIEILNLDDLDNTEYFCDADCVIIDDLLTLTPSVLKFIKYNIHHQNLTCFLLTQSLIADKLYSLTYLVHNLVLFFNTSSASRTVLELLHRFFISSQTKDYLRQIISSAEKDQSIVCIKLNRVASYKGSARDILAFSKLERLDTKEYCEAFPDIGRMEDFQTLKFDPSKLDPNQMVLIPARFVKPLEKEDMNTVGCTAQDNWDNMVKTLSDDIESNFKYSKWANAKALTREILRNDSVCISADYRLILLKDKSRFQIPFLDFLMVACRKPGPSENLDRYAEYEPLMKVLLQNNAPTSLFVNKLLLQTPLNKRAKPNRHISLKHNSFKHRNGRFL